MLVVNMIEITEVNQVPVWLFVLGLIVFCLATKKPHGGIAYRGLAYSIYGKRGWYLSNKLFGALLMVSSLLIFLTFKLFLLSAGTKIVILCLSCFACVISTEIVTIISIKKQEN